MHSSQSSQSRSPSIYENNFKTFKELCMYCLCPERAITPDGQQEPETENSVENSVFTTQPMPNAMSEFLCSSSMASATISMEANSELCIRQRTMSQLRLDTKRKPSKSKPYIEKSSWIEDEYIEEGFLKNTFSDYDQEVDDDVFLFTECESMIRRSSPAALFVKMKNQHGNKVSAEPCVPTKVEVANWVQQQLIYSPPQRKHTT